MLVNIYFSVAKRKNDPFPWHPIKEESSDLHIIIKIEMIE